MLLMLPGVSVNKKEKQMKPAILVRYRFICERKRLKRLKKRIEGHKVS